MVFEWDQANTGHIAEHEVTPEEAEQVMASDPMIREFQIVDGEERCAALGITNRGRVLLVWWTVRRERIRVVTAFEPAKRLKKAYLKERGMIER
jgi:uncharacterized DUF497 family protein